jgi:hypothetical protein
MRIGSFGVRLLSLLLCVHESGERTSILPGADGGVCTPLLFSVPRDTKHRYPRSFTLLLQIHVESHFSQAGC